MRRQNSGALSGLFLGLVALGGCSTPGAPEVAGTLKSLESRSAAIAPDKGVAANDEATIAAYREYLKRAPQEVQRPEALRRLGDLEIDRADGRSAAPSADRQAEVQSYQHAAALYRELLVAHPDDPANDHVLYQLAHAYELAGDLESALRMLDRLVRQYPHTSLRDEAQFRRGELLFTTRDYAGAEQAYATILAVQGHTPYFERALYMHGWSRYKQGRLEDALQSFFGVLDLKLIARQGEGSLDTVPGLTRADRELVEDTLRVSSLCLENLQGADTIPVYMNSMLRRDYEYRIYEQLGELYLHQERSKDAADTFTAFARRHPLDPAAPVLQARVIEIYRQAGFDTLVLETKKEFAGSYGAASEFRRANPKSWERVKPVIRMYLSELARHYHAAAQKSKKSDDYQAAVRWYRELLTSFPGDAESAQDNFLLAELLFEDGKFAQAAPEYEKAAYHYPPHGKSADAGYAALLAYAAQEKRLAPADRKPVQLLGIESAQRFADAFASDSRVGQVLTDAAEQLYALRDFEKAPAVAERVLALKPPADPAQRRVAWKVIAHASFDSGAFARAEKAYSELLALTPTQDPDRGALTERLAGSVYKQGEQARAQGRLREAVDDFQRVALVAPASPVSATAQYDAAAVLIESKDWTHAASALEDFRRHYPGHPLQPQVSDKLAFVYTESGQWSLAAGEFERMAASRTDAQLARAALWQAAEFHEKAGSRPAAAKVYERYVAQYPQPLEPAIEARSRLARLAREDGDSAAALLRQRELMVAEQAGGAARTDHTRYLGAAAALALAEPAYQEYRKVALVEPLKKQLKLKKARLEDVLKAYAVAANYGVADIATAATFRTAQLYQEFGKELLASERPKGLSPDEIEQYNVLLEEQAFPFEEKAIELHEANARHSAQGIYDQWVKSSYAALVQLRPVRYGKSERSEGTVDAIR